MLIYAVFLWGMYVPAGYLTGVVYANQNGMKSSEVLIGIVSAIAPPIGCALAIVTLIKDDMK